MSSLKQKILSLANRKFNFFSQRKNNKNCTNLTKLCKYYSHFLKVSATIEIVLSRILLMKIIKELFSSKMHSCRIDVIHSKYFFCCFVSYLKNKNKIKTMKKYSGTLTFLCLCTWKIKESYISNLNEYEATYLLLWGFFIFQ